MDEVPADLAAAVAADPPVQNNDKVDALRAACDEFRSEDADIDELEERLAVKKTRRHHLATVVIPEKMDDCAVAAIELEARGNYPAVRIEMRPHITANIAAAWPEEKRRAAFDWLDANKCGDLIKTQLSVFFPRERRGDALAAAKQLEGLNLNLSVEVKESVHQQTLMSWLQASVKKGVATPLDVIGGYVGRIAHVKDKKEER